MVSLYMREWIEIRLNAQQLKKCTVSLYMREWIEIYLVLLVHLLRFPVSLYMREWIEIWEDMTVGVGRLGSLSI